MLLSLLYIPYVFPVIIGVSMLTFPSFSPIFIVPVEALYIPQFSVDVTFVLPFMFISESLLFIAAFYVFVKNPDGLLRLFGL